MDSIELQQQQQQPLQSNPSNSALNVHLQSDSSMKQIQLPSSLLTDHNELMNTMQKRTFSKENLSPSNAADIVSSLEDQLIIERRNIVESAMKVQQQQQSSVKKEPSTKANETPQQKQTEKKKPSFNQPEAQISVPSFSQQQQDKPTPQPVTKPKASTQQNANIPQGQIIFNTREVRYPVIKRVARKVFGWKLSKCRKPGEEHEWDVLWTDDVFSAEKLQGMKPHQVINHFPAMYLVALKHNLAKYLKLMQKAFAEEYSFFPKTWITPYEFFDLNNYIAQRKQAGQGLTLIVKPQNQCQGKGIFLTRRVEDIPRDKCHVVQQYQQQPYLIDGRKFDLRVYVLVTQVEPHLVAFMYADGLGRFATEAYSAPKTNEACQNLFVHLTNYAINKNSEKFTAESEGEFKKQLKELYEYFASEGHDVEQLKSTIADMVIKTLLSVHSQLAHSYRACTPNYAGSRTCFELLGFDILIDKKFKPWLLEVNHAPSFNDDTEVDKEVKTNLITDTLRLLNITYADKMRVINKQRNDIDKKKMNHISSNGNAEEDSDEEQRVTYEQYQMANLGAYTKIYPFPHTKEDGSTEEQRSKWETYEGIIAHAKEIWVKQTGVNNTGNASGQPNKQTAGQIKPDPKSSKLNAAQAKKAEEKPIAKKGTQSAGVERKQDPRMQKIKEEDDEYGYGQSGRGGIPNSQLCGFQQEQHEDDFDDLLGQEEISPQQVPRVQQQQPMQQPIPIVNHSFTSGGKPPMPVNAQLQQQQIRTLRRVSTGASTSSTTFSSHSQRRQQPGVTTSSSNTVGLKQATSKSIDSKQPRIGTKRTTALSNSQKPQLQKQALQANQVILDPFSNQSDTQPSSSQAQGLFPQISGTRSNYNQESNPPSQISQYMVPTRQTAKIKQAGRALAMPNQVLEFGIGGNSMQQNLPQRSQNGRTNRENDLLDDLTAAFHSQNERQTMQQQKRPTVTLKQQDLSQPRSGTLGNGGIETKNKLDTSNPLSIAGNSNPLRTQGIQAKSSSTSNSIGAGNAKKSRFDYKTGPEAVRAIAAQTSMLLSGKSQVYF